TQGIVDGSTSSRTRVGVAPPGLSRISLYPPPTHESPEKPATARWNVPSNGSERLNTGQLLPHVFVTAQLPSRTGVLPTAWKVASRSVSSGWRFDTWVASGVSSRVVTRATI